MNDPSNMMNRNFGIWPLQQPPPPMPPLTSQPDDAMGFQKPPFPAFSAPRIGNWKGKNPAGKRSKPVISSAASSGVSGYKPPTLKELQSQNRAKARRFYPNKKKFARFAPFAPRNTTSFIIRAKKSGGIASLVSPCPVTPAILPTPKFSPSREGLVDMAKEEWGVDGYGSMKGLIRLRSPGRADELADDDADDSGSSESDVEEHLEVERRLDHDLSRFEMVYPSHGEDAATTATYLLENRVDDQDTQIAQLEEENLTLKERLFIMEREMAELRGRLQLLEESHNGRQRNDNNNNGDENDNNNSIVNNGNCEVGEDDGSENDAGGDVCSEKSVADDEGGENLGNNEEGVTPMRE